MFLNSGIQEELYVILFQEKKIASLWMHMSEDQILLLVHQQESDLPSCKLKLVSTQKKSTNSIMFINIVLCLYFKQSNFLLFQELSYLEYCIQFWATL